MTWHPTYSIGAEKCKKYLRNPTLWAKKAATSTTVPQTFQERFQRHFLHMKVGGLHLTMAALLEHDAATAATIDLRTNERLGRPGNRCKNLFLSQSFQHSKRKTKVSNDFNIHVL